MKLLSISEFIGKATAAFKRFPFTLTWAIVSTIIVVILIEKDMNYLFEENNRLLLVMILGIAWLIGAQFYIEQFKKAKQLWWIKITVVLAIVGVYLILPPNDRASNVPTPYIRWGLFLLAGHLSLFFAPFLTTWHPKAYWNYLSNMIIASGRSALFSGVLYLGLALALLAVQYLFNVDIDEKRYGQLFVICLGIVNTWVYLSDFPKEIRHSIHMHFNKPTVVFVKFILIPLVSLYMIILYAYALKIFMNWELPKGWVSYLITALAGLILLIQLIIHPIRITHESRLIRRFQPLFYWLFLPLLLLLYIAIYKRVSDYGITEARYFLLLLTAFITGAMLYLIFSRKQQLRFLPMALCILAMLGSFGFWGAFSVSEWSQKIQFEEVYSAFAKPVLSSVEVADTNTVTQEQADRFVSIAKYLDERDLLQTTEALLGYNPKEVFPDVSSWNIGDEMLKKQGIIAISDPIYFGFKEFKSDDSKAINVEGYAWMNTMYLRVNSAKDYSGHILNGYSFSIHTENDEIQVSKNQQMVLTLALRPLRNLLYQSE
ncbi:MAG: hypothetical protein ACI81G_001136, partial [Gammaproteobacteria bacterium]